jgi:hypothetical protein
MKNTSTTKKGKHAHKRNENGIKIVKNEINTNFKFYVPGCNRDNVNTYSNTIINTNSNNTTNINRNSLEDVALEINQIYNKNIERLRFLNDIEGKIKLTNVNQNQFGNDSNKTVDNIVKENYDDFINKINQTCNPQY